MKRLLAFSILTLMTASVFAASATGTASATVLAPMTITKVNDLQFGSFAPTTAAGTVTIAGTSSGARTGSAVSLSAGSTSGSASFNLTGTANSSYAITLPTSATLTSGANSMAMNGFTSTPSGTGTLTAGAATIYVGATLQVSTNQAAGTYTGTFPVSVDYN